MSAYSFRRGAPKQKPPGPSFDFQIKSGTVEMLAAKIKNLCSRYHLNVAMKYPQPEWSSTVISIWRKVGKAAKERDATLRSPEERNWSLQSLKLSRRRKWVDATERFVTYAEGLFKGIEHTPGRSVLKGGEKQQPIPEKPVLHSERPLIDYHYAKHVDPNPLQKAEYTLPLSHDTTHALEEETSEPQKAAVGPRIKYLHKDFLIPPRIWKQGQILPLRYDDSHALREETGGFKEASMSAESTTDQHHISTTLSGADGEDNQLAQEVADILGLYLDDA